MTYDLLWRFHALLMSTSFLAMFSGILISLIFKKKKWRYKTHKRLGIYAGLSGAAALIIAFTMVQYFKGVHFSSRHALPGCTAGLLLILTPLAGLHIRKASDKKRMKLIHKITGYITVLLMAVTIFSGLLLTGIVSLAAEESEHLPSVPAVPVLEGGSKVTAGNVTFSWKISEDFLEAVMSAPVEGWVAVGFNPENMMEGANFIIGYVQDGQGYIRDDYGSWLTSHDEDEKLGGMNNVELLAAGEDSTATWLHFRIPLNSADEFDHTFISGEKIPVIFASSSRDSFSGMHHSSGKEILTF